MFAPVDRPRVVCSAWNAPLLHRVAHPSTLRADARAAQASSGRRQLHVTQRLRRGARAGDRLSALGRRQTCGRSQLQYFFAATHAQSQIFQSRWTGSQGDMGTQYALAGRA